MKPKQILIFILSVIAMLASIMFVFPKEGIKLSDNLVLYFPDFKEMFSKTNPSVDIDSIINNQINIDSLENLMEEDSTTVLDIEALKKLITPIEYPNNDSTLLYPFFAKLNNIEQLGKVRITHYGDSQIEGDRITSFIRYKLQARFGGKGYGLNTVSSLYAQFSMIQENSDNWNRYTSYINIDEKIKHNKYGAMAAYSRFTPIRDSLEPISEVITEAWISFTKSNLCYQNTQSFKQVSLYYGNSISPTKIEITVNDTIALSDMLKIDTGLNVLRYLAPNYIDNIRFDFKGYESPDFYGISFEDDHGLIIDNIGLRGSSGTMFRRINSQQLSEMYALMGTDLFILQFGGNVMPYIKTEEEAEQHADYFYYQIKYLQNLVPDVKIIVVGPSDMSTKIKDKYATYPLLEKVRDELKNASFEAGAAYWDMYGAMGGKNSMKAWVNSDPPLASTDYTHFTPQGAQVIGNMLYNALIVEYTQYANELKQTGKQE
jgi:lysophospholipase L1-like esterase